MLQTEQENQCAPQTERGKSKISGIENPPDLSNVDQGEVEQPQQGHEDHVGTASQQHKGCHCQASQGQAVQGAVHVRPVQEPDERGCVAQGIQADLPFEVLLDILQVELAGEQPLLSHQLLVLVKRHQEGHDCRRTRRGGKCVRNGPG